MVITLYPQIILLRDNIVSHLTKFNLSVVAPLVTDMESGM